jgi:hypothetical protein
MEEMSHFYLVLTEKYNENQVKAWLPLFFGNPTSVSTPVPETYIQQCNKLGLEAESMIQFMYDIAIKKLPESSNHKDTIRHILSRLDPCRDIDIIFICKEFHKLTRQVISKSSIEKWIDAMKFVCDKTHSRRYKEKLDFSYDNNETEHYLSCMFDSIMKNHINVERISMWKNRLVIVTHSSWADESEEMDFSQPLQV